MDAGTIASATDLLTKGGNVSLFFALYIAWRAGQTASEAVRSLTKIAESVERAGPVLEKMAGDVENIERMTEQLDARSSRADLQLQALVARRQ
jgi:hypothetical protein